MLCDGIEDPHNLGAIVRTALLCGAHGVVIPKRGGVAVTPTVMKASAGAAARLPVARVANLGECIRKLKEQGVFVYCADMDGTPLEQQNLTGPVALVLGSEGKGPSAPCKKPVRRRGEPFHGRRGTGVDSLTCLLRRALLLYEIMRQRA